ncbi:Uncharacterised protein [Mycobacteroides abscessus]|nr:Uncharacterised protein [Mycobacteroides abscessus]
MRPASPAPSARICHILVASGPAGRIIVASLPDAATIASAFAIASSGVAPPTSTMSQPAPGGSGGTDASPLARRTTSTSRASRPSTARGLRPRKVGTSSAADGMSG